MKHASLLILVAAVVLGALVPLHPSPVSAQPEETPILGEPVVMTPIVSAPGDDDEASAAPPSTGSAVPQGNQTTSMVTATTTPEANQRPDACEPNNAPAQACALSLDAISGPFTIVPEDDQDFFLLDLPQELSIQTAITVRATSGLDLFLSARQGAQIVASGTYSLTLAPDLAGPVVLRVENRDPRSAAGESYRVEVRREIVPPNQTSAAASATPDALENNWSFATAAPIAVGVVYDLSFVCPEERSAACPGGDHDYLIVPVKAGVNYLLATFDLDPGVDTVVELFWNEATIAVAGNDDYSPGGMLSALRWTAPNDGLLGVRIAPRNGGLAQRGAEVQASYRFAVAPVASELARKLEASIRQQANVPTPTAIAAATPPSTGGSSSGGGTGSSVSSAPASGSAAAGTSETIATGPAVVVRETVLRREPNEQATALATLPGETRVSVRGPVRGLWVNVESEASILPGWVRFSDLQRLGAEPGPAQTASVNASATATVQQPGAATMSSPPSASVVSSGSPSSGSVTPRVVATELDPALPAPPLAPASRVPFTIAVTVIASDEPLGGGGTLGFVTPTPDLQRRIGRVRIQLLNIFGDVLAEGLTDRTGVVQLRRDIRAGDALRVRMPAWGVEVVVASDQTTLVVTVPEERS